MRLMHMSTERSDRLFRIILFVLLLFGIIEIQPLLGIFLTGDLLALSITLSFFGVLFLMYVLVLKFLEMEDRSGLTTVGVVVDDSAVVELLLGGIAGFVAAAFVWAMAYTFDADLRPFTEITTELIIGQVIITTLVAFFEELAYRGYMMTRMDELWGRGKAIVLSSLVFSVLHFSWWTPLGSVPLHLVLLFTINLFLGGVVLGTSYYWSGERLWVPIGYHFFWNMVAYIVFPTFPIVPVSMPEVFQIEWGITSIPGFLIGMVTVYVLVRILVRRRE